MPGFEAIRWIIALAAEWSPCFPRIWLALFFARKWHWDIVRWITFPFFVIRNLVTKDFFIFYLLLIICIVNPLPPGWIVIVIWCSTVIIFSNSAIFLRAQSWLYFSRPRRTIIISTLYPFVKNSSAWLALTCKSFLAARGVIRTCFNPPDGFWECFFSSFFCW